MRASAIPLNGTLTRPCTAFISFNRYEYCTVTDEAAHCFCRLDRNMATSTVPLLMKRSAMAASSR